MPQQKTKISLNVDIHFIRIKMNEKEKKNRYISKYFKIIEILNILRE